MRVRDANASKTAAVLQAVPCGVHAAVAAEIHQTGIAGSEGRRTEGGGDAQLDDVKRDTAIVRSIDSVKQAAKQAAVGASGSLDPPVKQYQKEDRRGGRHDTTRNVDRD